VREFVERHLVENLRTPNALDALVTREQVRFKQALKTVCAARWIPDKIRESSRPSGEQLRTPGGRKC